MANDLRTFEVDGQVLGITPKQLWATKKIIEHDPRVAIYVGSIRSGKTVGSLFPFIRHAQRRGDRGDLLMIGKSLDTLERNVLQPASTFLGEGLFNYKKGARSAYIAGKQVHLMSAYDRSSYKKLRGATVAGWLGDEVTLWPNNFFDELLGRMSPRGAQGIGTTNPDHPEHWLLSDWLSRIEEDALNWLHFRFRLADNNFLADEFVEAIKREYRGLYYQRLVLGMWVMAAGAVFDMFDTSVHVRSCPQGFDHYGIGIDVGTVNPTCFLLFGWNDATERVHVLDCYYHEGGDDNQRRKTNSEYADDFADFASGVPLDAIVVDPSAADFIAELRDRGYNITSAKNAVIDGINFTASLLGFQEQGEERLWVNDIEATDPVKEEFQSYVWDERDGVTHDQPVKENDHAMDALRYFLYTHIAPIIRNRSRSSPKPRSRIG